MVDVNHSECEHGWNVVYFQWRNLLGNLTWGAGLGYSLCSYTDHADVSRKNNPNAVDVTASMNLIAA